jgi:UDP-N-acetylglucosamine:LPS N-acetylglucosamine transferase
MVKNKKDLHICLVGSAGGHLSQLLKIHECWQRYNTIYITTTDTGRDKIQILDKVYVVGESNRRHPLRLLKVSANCAKIVLREKPDVVISTGASVGCIVCFMGKLLGAKIIWIDSITNVKRLSLSGRMVKYIADLFLVQWPNLIKHYSNVECEGAVI